MSTPGGPGDGQSRRRMTTLLTVVLGLALAAGVIAVAVTFQGSARRTPACGATEAEPGFPGRSGNESCRLPALELARLDSDGTLDLAEMRGTPMVVNFWATWCEPCVREMPMLGGAARDLTDKVTFVGVNVQDRAAQARDLAARTGVDYPLLSDPQGALYQAIQGSGMPTTLFINADGVVVYRRTGEVDRASFAKLLQEHLGVIWEAEGAA